MENIKSILDQNIIGTLATVSADGSPWATPVHIFADDDSLYWFSKDEHRHSVNILLNGKVSVALWSQTDGTKGAYISGIATRVDAAETPAALDIVVSTVGKIPPVFENTSAYRLPIGQLNTGKSSEKRWYFYTENH